MKRILISAALAIGIHAILLTTEFNWRGQFSANRSTPHILTLSLTVQPSQTASERPPFKKPDQPFQKQVQIKARSPKPLKKHPHAPVAPEVPSPSTAQKSLPSISQAPADSYQTEVDPVQSEAGLVQPAVENHTQAAAVTQAVREARPIYRLNPSPRYPALARRRGLQGDLVLEVLIDRDGNVGDLRIRKSSGFSILDRAAIDSVKKWSFVPGMRGNEPLEMWVRIPIQFKLE